MRTAPVWICPSCGIEVLMDDRMCNLCKRGRPMDRRNCQQIFAGMVFHFNGVIPRTFKHPSHSVEWRMAERHGATVLEELDMERVTHLIYRPGYERSEKVRRCLPRRTIHVVPISWLLDSLLQSRPIHESMVELRGIPEAPVAAAKGTILPHHNHPFYVANAEDYELLTPEEREEQRLQFDALRQEAAIKALSGESRKSVGGDLGVKGMPPLPDFPRLRPRKQELAKIPGNKHLFTGMVVAFSPTCVADGYPQIAVAHSAVDPATLSAGNGTDDAAGLSVATHIIFHNSDKKSPFMLTALAAVENPSVEHKPVLLSQQWFEDCVMLNERIPELGPYTPSDKLVAALKKKQKQ